MKRFNKFAALCALSLLFANARVYAEDRPLGERHKGMMDELQLTPEQKDKMKQFRERHEEMKLEHEKLRNDRDRLKILLKDPKSSDADIQKLSDDLSDRMAALMKQRIRGMLELRKTLKPEQFAKMMERFEEKGKKFGQEGGGGFGRRGFFGRDKDETDQNQDHHGGDDLDVN
jgi:Spy/CpxP family protein refolding chaperone